MSEKHFASGLKRKSPLADKNRETWIWCPPQQCEVGGLGWVPARAGLECSSLGNLATEICTSGGLPKSFVAHTLRLILSLKEPCVSVALTWLGVSGCMWLAQCYTEEPEWMEVSVVRPARVHHPDWCVSYLIAFSGKTVRAMTHTACAMSAL